jgi:hypothetical protein
MSTYSEILDEEVEFKKPARFTTGRKFRDNVLAIAAGDATVPNDKRVDPRGMRRPTAASQTFRLAEQLQETIVVPAFSTRTLFLCRIIVPGVYTLAGVKDSTSSNTIVRIFVNEVEVFSAGSGVGSFSEELTLSAGDKVRLEGQRTDFGDRTFSECRFMSEYTVPILQGQFAS